MGTLGGTVGVGNGINNIGWISGVSTTAEGQFVLRCGAPAGSSTWARLGERTARSNGR